MKLLVLILNLLFFSNSVAYSYFGHVLGIGAIYVLILFLFTIILLFFSIFLYPIKKAYKFFFKKKETGNDTEKKRKD